MKLQHILRADAARIWKAALLSVDPEEAVRKVVKRQGEILRIGRRQFQLKKIRKLWILGAGKAAAPMGQALERILGKYISGGILVTKYGHSLPLKRLEIFEAGHPLPDANGRAAASRMLTLLREEIGPDDLAICVLSGGASALLVSPAENISLKDKLQCTQLLLNCGANIHEMNAVRKHLSRVKGGGMARLIAPTRTVSLILSDVVGDDVTTIASGPMAPDPTTFADCLQILRKFEVLERVPASVRRCFELGAAGKLEETPKVGDPAFIKSESIIVGSNAQACTAAARMAKRLGYHATVLTSRLEGDTGEAARFHMNIAWEILSHRRPIRRPACIISGGETTVQVTGKGKGGRNQEFTLRCVSELARLPVPCVVASVGTDGTDGPTDAAGAIADTATYSRSLKFGDQFLNESLNNNDSYRFFHCLNDLIITGPTRTNVMDLRIVMVG